MKHGKYSRKDLDKINQALGALYGKNRVAIDCYKRPPASVETVGDQKRLPGRQGRNRAATASQLSQD